jgi:hypothetical protein
MMNMATNIMTLRNIRMAVCEKLKEANLPFIGEDVFCNRAEKAWPQEKAFLSVYVQQSSFDTQDIQPEIYKVETDVVIDVVVQGSQELDGELFEIDDLFDMISSNVVDLLTSYPRPKFLVENQVFASDFTLRSFSDEINGEGETDKGTRKITFSAVWYFEPVTRNESLNNLEVIHSEINFGPQSRHLITSNREQVVTDAGLSIRVKLAGDKYKSYEFETNMR